MQESQLIINFTILLGVALVGGMIAHRLKQPVILGYLVVGVAVGPHALGLVNDLGLIESAATLGVALLMLTLGLEVSFAQLRQVGRVGLWGGSAQIFVTFLLGTMAASALFGWSWPQASLFGLVISLSSTMVCLKVLMDRGELDSMHGRVMLAILILQDVSVILMILVVPVLNGAGQNILLLMGMAMAKAVAFVGIAVALGAWLLPWLLGRVGGVRSRELFLLTVLVLGLGTALSTQLLGLSAVFGAFLIGLVLRETRFGHQALAEITPLRDIFGALFFVSLGMLLNLEAMASSWWLVGAAVALIIVVKFLVVFGIVRAFRYSAGVALLAGAGLFQVGEFSFILAQGGVNAALISAQSYSLIIASAIVTMLLTPLSMGLASMLYTRLATRAVGHGANTQPLPASFNPSQAPEADNLVILAGYGRVGENVARGLRDAGVPYTVVELDPEVVSDLRSDRATCLYGDASNAHVLSQAGIRQARVLVVTFPDPLSVFATVRNALSINPRLKVVARVHRAGDAQRLKDLGVEELVSPEYEASLGFLRRVLASSGWQQEDVAHTMAEVCKNQAIVNSCLAREE